MTFLRDGGEDYDRELKEEINRKYEGRSTEIDQTEHQRRIGFTARIVALTLALIFLFTVTGRWLAVFAGPAMYFLRESWALSDEPLVQDLRQAVVQIQVERPIGSPQSSSRGTGFNIASEGLIITNRHIVEDAANVRVSFAERGSYSAQSWHESSHVDLALIELQSRDLPFVDLANEPPEPEEELLVIGNPLQFTRVANRGILEGYRPNPTREIPYLVIEAMIYPGSSGSPLFTKEGEVVGVVFATLRNRDPAEVRGVAVSAEEVIQFLQESNYLRMLYDWQERINEVDD